MRELNLYLVIFNKDGEYTPYEIVALSKGLAVEIAREEYKKQYGFDNLSYKAFEIKHPTKFIYKELVR